jgi:hypothetical protein
MWEKVVEYGLGIVDKVLGLFKSQADANSNAVVKQSGVDAEKSASLSAQVKVVQAENKALVNAPSTEAGTISDLSKGAF